MESIIAAILSGVVTLIGVLIANSRSNAVMEYKIEELTREVRKHNGFAEKIPVIQRDIQVQGISVERVYAYADRLLGNAGGCGIYPPGLGRANGWVHVDVRKAKSRWKG